jgi:hypothetical protein
MSLGEAWADILPPLNPERSFLLLDAWYQAGGVHIDTSNHYQVSQTAHQTSQRPGTSSKLMRSLERGERDDHRGVAGRPRDPRPLGHRHQVRLDVRPLKSGCWFQSDAMLRTLIQIPWLEARQERGCEPVWEPPQEHIRVSSRVSQEASDRLCQCGLSRRGVC